MDFQSAMETFAEAWVAANAGAQVMKHNKTETYLNSLLFSYYLYRVVTTKRHTKNNHSIRIHTPASNILTTLHLFFRRSPVFNIGLVPIEIMNARMRSESDKKF